MYLKKQTFILILFFLYVHPAISITWTTISEGYWNDPLVWSTGIVPPYTSSDTFIIEHPVAFMGNIVLNAGAFLQIDSIGGLCAHRDITVNTGARIIKYGILEADTLFIPGGNVNCYIPGDVILWRSAIISNGGSFSSNCSLSVGPWFDCRRPPFDFMDAVTEFENENTISIIPNPANEIIEISLPQKSEIEILNLNGKTIKSIYSNSKSTTVDLTELSSGVYIVRVKTDKEIVTRKFIKE